MAAEYNALFAALGKLAEHSDITITVLRVRMQGNGARKPDKFLRTQRTEVLREYDDATFGGVVVPNSGYRTRMPFG